MTRVNGVAFIGNSLPRRCGIATFTSDLQVAVAESDPTLRTAIVAMSDNDDAYEYPTAVGFQVKDDQLEDYVRAAEYLNMGQFDVVSLQHEFGIFGGEAGSHLLALLSRLKMPVVTTLHTVLAKPSLIQRSVLERILGSSARVVVMAETGRDLLRTIYRVPTERIDVIPHGIPDVAFLEPNHAKAELGFSGRAVILTFGLLSPNKGIEVMIDAMPEILKRRPDAIYVILGATHPKLLREQGESYRESLVARVLKLGIVGSVILLDQFVDQATLLRFISMCDVYVTPYLDEAQLTSGTLAYSFGLGKAVVSTPYWHARELLADDRGVLVPFADSGALSTAIADLLTDDARRQAMRRRAYASSRSMIWAETAKRYRAAFEEARCGHALRVISLPQGSRVVPDSRAPPAMEMGHLLTLCDDTGLFQHAIYSIPDCAHGYCVDDNARVLLLACALNTPGEQPFPETLNARIASFVHHAWNPETRRFRNFMSFDRHWLEASGSEDSHGRTLWALGACAGGDKSPARWLWASTLFAEALPSVEAFSSPRAWAFTLLGLNAYCAAGRTDLPARRLRLVLADRLMGLLAAVETPEWVWFEEGLSYDNARLPQALIETGMAVGVPAYTQAGLRSLRWLMERQTGPTGFFRPIGTESFGEKRSVTRMFDQQPLEATASISACLAALRADGDPDWRQDAARAFAWFFGSNELAAPLVDLETGSCRDGLHSDRPNENKGGEFAVSYLLSLAEIRHLARVSEGRTQLGLRQAVSRA